MQPYSPQKQQKGSSKNSVFPQVIQKCKSSKYQHFDQAINQTQKFNTQLFQNQIHQTVHQKDRIDQLINAEFNSIKPELLDINTTSDNRKRHNILKKKIQSTILDLLRIYKNKNIVRNSEEQNKAKDEIFENFSFIFSQMNEFSSQIQQTISYLNQGQSCEKVQIETTPQKKICVQIDRMPQISQSFEQQQMREENESRNENQQYSPNFMSHVSLQQISQSKLNQNGMQDQS